MQRFTMRALVCCVLAAGVGTASAQSPPDRDRFLVIPFDNPGHEARIYWLAEASAILLADGLNASGRHAYTREERLARPAVSGWLAQALRG